MSDNPHDEGTDWMWCYERPKEAAAEIDRLREDCTQAYQVIGTLAHQAGVFHHPDTVKALDNMLAAAEGEPRPHADLLPFGLTLPDRQA